MIEMRSQSCLLVLGLSTDHDRPQPLHQTSDRELPRAICVPRPSPQGATLNLACLPADKFDSGRVGFERTSINNEYLPPAAQPSRHSFAERKAFVSKTVETNVAWKPEDFESMTEPVRATPYPAAPSIVIAYPSPLDWRRLYDRNGWKDVRWLREHYADMSRSHERSVTKQLDMISSPRTGRAVFAEMNARSAYSVMIFPFDLLPRAHWGPGKGAVTLAVEERASWARGVPMCGATAQGTSYCSGSDAPTGAGTGSAVDIYFTASRYDGGVQTADEALLHELVHASRKVKGITYRMPVGAGYGNLEEFLAMLVENIYRSEKRQPPIDYHGNAIDSRSFLDDVPASRTLIAQFRRVQQALFSALANIETSFNPLRQFEAERKVEEQRFEKA